MFQDVSNSVIQLSYFVKFRILLGTRDFLRVAPKRPNKVSMSLTFSRYRRSSTSLGFGHRQYGRGNTKQIIPLHPVVSYALVTCSSFLPSSHSSLTANARSLFRKNPIICYIFFSEQYDATWVQENNYYMYTMYNK